MSVIRRVATIVFLLVALAGCEAADLVRWRWTSARHGGYTKWAMAFLGAAAQHDSAQLARYARGPW